MAQLAPWNLNKELDGLSHHTQAIGFQTVAIF